MKFVIAAVLLVALVAVVVPARAEAADDALAKAGQAIKEAIIEILKAGKALFLKLLEKAATVPFLQDYVQALKRGLGLWDIIKKLIPIIG